MQRDFFRLFVMHLEVYLSPPFLTGAGRTREKCFFWTMLYNDSNYNDF